MDDLEQRIKVIFETNADTASGQVDKVSSSIEKSTDSQEKNTESQKSFKAQLREANAELQKSVGLYGETAKETANAAKKVADLKDQMAFAKDLSDSFNPDQKFKALGAATQLAATGVQGVVAGYALFGDQSKDTEKVLLKVQAAMAFSDAVSNLSNIGDQFKVLKTVVVSSLTSLTTARTANTVAEESGDAVQKKGIISRGIAIVQSGIQATVTGVVTAAQWVWNAAMSANPIGAIVVVVAALVAGIYFLINAISASNSATEKASKANNKLSKDIDDLTASAKKSNEQTQLTNGYLIAMAKAHGTSAEKVRLLSEELINQEVAEKRLNAVKSQSFALEAQRVASLEDATDEQKATAKKARESFVEQNGIYNDSLKSRKKMAMDHSVEIVQEETNRETKLAENRQKAADAAEAFQAKKEAEKKAKEKKLTEEAKKINEDAKLENDKRSKTDLEFEEELFQKKSALLKAQKISTEALEIEHLNKLNDINVANAAKAKEVELKAAADAKELFNKNIEEKTKEADNEKLSFDARIEQTKASDDLINANLTLSEDRKNKLLQDNVDKRKEIDKIEKEYKEQELEKGISNLQNILSIGGEKTKKISKALAIADIVRTSAKSVAESVAEIGKANTGALGTPQAIASGGVSAIPTIAFNTIKGGLQIGSTIASATKAIQTINSDSKSAPSGGGGSGGGGGGGAPSSSVPQVQFQGSKENQIGNAIAGKINEQPPIKTYVVAKDVTTQQGFDNNKINGNTL